MSKLLYLPASSRPRGTLSKGKDGYRALDEPVKSHTVSAGGIQQEVEMGDLANDAFYDEVASIRETIRRYDEQLTLLQTKHLYSLQPHDASVSEAISVELTQLNATLSLESTSIKKRISDLGGQVGADEARRGHWDNVKSALRRSVERWASLETAQRERVRERVARQYRIVKPDATDDEVRDVLATSATTAPQVFQQALSGSQRTSAALSALSEAQTRQTELAQIESTLIELAQLVQQVAELVAEQDAGIQRLEGTSAAIEQDVETGLKEVQKAKVRALATRHRRKICAAVALSMVVILVVVIVVQRSRSHSMSDIRLVSAAETE
ncbi:hypothetical protein JCM10212_000012 [Sporobolomyces blumeae]